MMKFSIIIIIIVGLMAIISWLTPVRSNCISPVEVKEITPLKYPKLHFFLHIKNNTAQKFMDSFNASKTIPYIGDEIVGFYHPNHPDFLLIIFTKGCRTGLIFMTPAEFQKHYLNFKLFEPV